MGYTRKEGEKGQENTGQGPSRERKDKERQGKTREAEIKEGRIQRNRGKWYSRVENYGKEKNRGKRRKEESEQFLKI